MPGWVRELAVVAVAVSLVSMWQTRHHLRGPMPAFSVRSLAGSGFSLADVTRGKPTLLYVWAPWCGVCRAESQNIGWVRGWLGERANVVSLATAYESESEVRTTVAARAPAYPVYLADERARQALHVDVFPTIYFLDGAGNVKRSVSGYTTSLGLLWRLLLP